VWHKWEVFFSVFLLIVDRRNGNFLHLPFNLPPFFQPFKSMQVFELIQSIYFEKIKEDYEKVGR